jgi:sarcosine oxidase subunit alpha
VADRLRAGPADRIDRDRRIEFTFDGRTFQAHPGDTVGSALAAAGVRTLSRSFKYHRPRGMLCCAGRCPNCLVDVDGVPSVRACVAPARDGMTVRHQNAWPSLGLDVMSLAGRFDRLLPIGFYYKIFHRPRFLWPLFEAILRRIAGLGRIDPAARPESHVRTRHLHAEVTVIGGGGAGCLAALDAAAAGARVVLIDEGDELGGHWRLTEATIQGDARVEGLPGHAAARRLHALAMEHPDIEVLTATTAFGLYEGSLVAASADTTLVRIRTRQVVLATGAAEVPALFANNDLPGVMLGTGVLRLARQYGVAAGRRVAVVTDDDAGWAVAGELIRAGLTVVAIVDSRGRDGGSIPSDLALAHGLEEAGVEIVAGTPRAAAGRGRVRALVVDTNSGERRLAVDIVAVSNRPEPVTALLGQDGGTRQFDPASQRFVPNVVPETIHLAGAIEGVAGDAYACAAGAHAGRMAARAAGFLDADPDPAGAVRERERRAASEPHIDPIQLDKDGKRFVCLCEDVTVAEIEQGIVEGFDDLEMMKRYSTLTMGPCQGKMCASLASCVQAQLTGRSADDVGLTTSRPPYQPVALATVAGPHETPTRRTPMHDRHATTTSRWVDLGEWTRPLIHRGVELESAAVRERVGLIDVSTLGKIDISGPDAGEFLDWLHPNRFSDLRQGRVRYRAMLDEAGVVIDDGTVARLGPDRFLLTTATGTLDAIDQWLRWWLAGTNRRVAVTNLTSELAAMNLAGPRARDVLAGLTDLDVSRDAMPYLTAIEGAVAGVPAIILRIGFVGELGYEIHVPADYGAHAWDALMDAGASHGIEPFGVETQRVLRLEKQHLIVSQDTDALSDPVGAGLGWLVKLDKPDFVGRAAVVDAIEQGVRPALVGFMLDGRTVPDEGAGMVRDGRLIGRVTSAKWSPHLQRTIGMAWLTEPPTTDGTRLAIRHDGRTVTATIVRRPFYDPTGERLRS